MANSKSQTILVVEGEQSIASFVSLYLKNAGYDVRTAATGSEALAQAAGNDVSLILLDLMLPDIDGIDVCRRIRQRSEVPILMLTARDEDVDKIIGLEVGADDYLTKPFSPRELVARLRAMLRRPRPIGGPARDDEGFRRFGPLTIDPTGRDVWLDDEPVALTRTEFDLLAVLSERPRMAYSRRQLIDAVWGQTWVGDEHLVDVHVGHLRRKLGDDANASRFIRTVRGVGYRMGTGE